MPLCFEIQKQRLEMPPSCACCLNAAQDSLSLDVAEPRPGGEQGQMIESSWDIPYCSFCAAHVRMHDRTLAAGVGAGIAAALIVLLVDGFTKAGTKEYVIAIGSGVVVALAAGFLMRGVLARRGARCVATGPAVGAAPAGTYAGERFKFTFLNADFGRKVAESNKAGTVVSG